MSPLLPHRRALRALASVVLVVLTARSGVAAPMPGERAATLERQIGEKKRAIEQLEKRNVDLQQAVDANPADAGANLAARQEVRQNVRYIAGYKSEIGDLERALARVRAAEANAPPAPPAGKAGATAKPLPRPCDDRAAAAVTATRTTQPVIPVPVRPGEPGALDTAQVHELMRSWALGRGGVPGAATVGVGAAPLALVIGALDWTLDWRELSAGVALGAALGWGLPVGLVTILRRRRPQRAPVVGSLSRKWANLAGAAGSPSKQWSDLAAKASTPVRIAAGVDGLLAAFALASALASLGGFGASLGTPGLWGEAAEVALALAFGAVAVGLWRRQMLAAAVAGFVLAVLAAVVPLALALTPFGGPGAVAWVMLLAVGAALQVPALVALWSLATPRAVGEARGGVPMVGAAVGALVGLAGAALHLVAA